MPQKKSAPAQAPAPRIKISQADLPNVSLEAALRIAEALWENFGGKSGAPHQIAMAIDMTPTGGAWRALCGASIAYGLTDGGYAANQISLTQLGRRIVAPTEEGDDQAAKVQAILTPRILREFYERYDKAKFPKEEIAKNILVSMGIPKERSDRALSVVKDNGTFAGIIHETKSGPFVAVDDPSPGKNPRPISSADKLVEDDGYEDDGVVLPGEQESTPATPEHAKPTGPEKPKKLFIAHGKNKKPLEDLKKILNEFKIPFVVAIDEANKGRPISAKVAELMHDCSAGIFIFTCDEQFFRQKKTDEYEEVWRPSENVVYELGAANILWDRKIIILREEGVNFPSDFSDLGYITFKDGEIASKAIDIFKELIALQLVKVSAA